MKHDIEYLMNNSLVDELILELLFRHPEGRKSYGQSVVNQLSVDLLAGKSVKVSQSDASALKSCQCPIQSLLEFKTDESGGIEAQFDKRKIIQAILPLLVDYEVSNLRGQITKYEKSIRLANDMIRIYEDL